MWGPLALLAIKSGDLAGNRFDVWNSSQSGPKNYGFYGNPYITQIWMSGKFLKRSKESPNCCQKVQTLQYSGQRQRNFESDIRLSIANSALDTISARPSLAASVLSSASFDSPCITIQVIYQGIRLPTACPYKRQAVPGWTCLPGPIKKFTDLTTVH